MERWPAFPTTGTPPDSAPNIEKVRGRLVDIGNGRKVVVRPFGRASEDFMDDEVRSAVEFHARGRELYQVVPSEGTDHMIALGIAGRTREEIFMELTSSRNIEAEDARQVVADLTDNERFAHTDGIFYNLLHWFFCIL